MTLGQYEQSPISWWEGTSEAYVLHSSLDMMGWHHLGLLSTCRDHVNDQALCVITILHRQWSSSTCKGGHWPRLCLEHESVTLSQLWSSSSCQSQVTTKNYVYEMNLSAILLLVTNSLHLSTHHCPPRLWVGLSLSAILVKQQAEPPLYWSLN